VAYHPLDPVRIMDTRSGLGGHLGALSAGQSVSLQVAGAGAPSGAYAAVLNVTVTGTSAPSYLTVYPAGAPRPLASNLNWTQWATVANLVEVRLGTGGALTLFNAAGQAQVIADLAGWVSTPSATPGAAGLYNALVPSRLLDTRDGTGAPRGAIAGGGAVSLQVTGRWGVPATGVGAVVLNVTAADVSLPTYVTVWPEGSVRPVVSNLNPGSGQTVANRVIVKLGTGGRVDLFNAAGSANLVADVNGWFSDGTVAAGGSTFTGMTPYRIVDTRDGTGNLGSSLWPGQAVAVQVPVGGQPVVQPPRCYLTRRGLTRRRVARGARARGASARRARGQDQPDDVVRRGGEQPVEGPRADHVVRW